VLLDTSILVRLLQPQDPLSILAAQAIDQWKSQYAIHIVPQNLYELWVVATRPPNVNGLGLSPEAALRELTKFKGSFYFLPDTPAVYTEWETLVHKHNIAGKPAHDARLVAAIRAHGLTAFLTFDPNVFARFPGIQVIVPQP
jgi:predicted nucleic acid-binding protein